MKIPLKEPNHAKYLYVSSDNVVHVLMPLISGTTIGLDNTCKAVLALKEFFGKGNDSNHKASLKDALLVYQEALENDISLLGAKEEALTQQKQERLTQIKAYLEVVKKLENNAELQCLTKGFGSYPRPLVALMQDRITSNLYSMILRPTVEDGYLRFEETNPIFSVAHKSEARGIAIVESKLQQALIEAYGLLSYEAKDTKSQVIKQVLEQLGSVMPIDFEQLKQCLQQTIKALLNISVDFSITQQGSPISQEDIDKYMGFVPQTTTHKEYIEALLGYCASDLFDTIVESPFNTLTDAESWSIATQFLLGITNFYCIAQNKISPDTNFGQILDKNPALSNSLAQTLAHAQQYNSSIEEDCLSWMNEHAEAMKLSALSQEDRKAIERIFAERYALIKKSQHFDEFFLLDLQKKGDFFIHQGHICTPFAKFVSSPLLKLPQKLTQSLEKAHSHASTLSTEIPHQNALTHGEVEINTASLDNTALQALYDRINTYTDQKLKQNLLAQLELERPNFKPQIHAKQFLQHIAYGEQDEAEKLLQIAPEIAQELLRAQNIPFTDYSGRTFTCTAYEYAWWAKDAHMLKMLEQYILPDDETRQFILERVNAIHEPVRQASSSWFSRFFSLSQPKPQGLHYTSQNSNGQTVDHWEVHFDLNPLKESLRTYIAVSEKIPFNLETGDRLWLKVGLLQREVPVHIAQEYCHPDRSFYKVSENKSLLDTSVPANLKRQLKFYNNETQAYDSWFTRRSDSSDSFDSSLGSSFAIIRGPRGHASGVRRREFDFVGLPDDLSAIEAIDEIRTENLKESLDNLNRPVIVHEPLSQGI